jgi:hypothetical protein
MQQQALTGFEQATDMRLVKRAARNREQYEPRPSFVDKLKQASGKFFRNYGNQLFPSYELRRLMQCEMQLYRSQQKIDDPVIFANFIKVVVGWCSWVPGPNGGIIPIAHPGGYHGCTNEELNGNLQKLKTFVDSKHARKFLWTHLTNDEQSVLLKQVFSKNNT